MLLAEPIQFEDSGLSLSNIQPRPAADPETLEAIFELSETILASPISRDYPDIAAFGFFCRKSNVMKYLKRFPDIPLRWGIGNVIHVSPGNIPVNFAFSFVMALIAGNRNLVRLPSRNYPQVDVLVELIEKVFKEFDSVSDNVFFRSSQGSPRLLALIEKADGIVVWGGNESVDYFRRLAKNPTSRELYFPSRASSVFINSKRLCEIGGNSLNKVVERFYNDTYLVDQNACSSPSMVFWVGTKKETEKAKEIFWNEVLESLRGKPAYFGPSGIRKLADFFDLVTARAEPIKVQTSTNAIWRTADKSVSGPELRFGFFLELEIAEIREAASHLRSNEQTVTYFGLEPSELLQELVTIGHGKVERIAPIGQALNLGFIWDGIDTLPALSRRISLE